MSKESSLFQRIRWGGLSENMGLKMVLRKKGGNRIGGDGSKEGWRKGIQVQRIACTDHDKGRSLGHSEVN